MIFPGHNKEIMNIFKFIFNCKNNKGVTLTELLISVAIIGLLSAVVGIFLINIFKFYRLNTAKGEIQRDARACIDLINRNLRQAISSSVTITRYNSNHPPCSMIQFTHIKGDAFRYYQLNNQFYISVCEQGTNTWRTNKISDNIRSVFFTYPDISDPTIVSVSLCFEKSTYQGATKALQLSVEKVRIMN